MLFTLMEERREPGKRADSSDDEDEVPLGGSRAVTKSRGRSLASEFEVFKLGSVGTTSSILSGDAEGPGSGGKGVSTIGEHSGHRRRASSDGDHDSDDDSGSDSSSEEEGEDLPFRLD